MDYYYLYIAIVFILTFIFIKITFYYKLADRASKRISIRSSEKVVLCECGHRHNAIENLKNICLHCKHHIYAEGPIFYHPNERAWVYGTSEDALVIDIEHFVCRSTTITSNAQVHACNRCGKQDIEKFRKILNAKYCYKCFDKIQKDKPRQRD